jgi:hypothetical protein
MAVPALATGAVPVGAPDKVMVVRREVWSASIWWLG